MKIAEMKCLRKWGMKMSEEIEKLIKIQNSLNKNKYHLFIQTNLDNEYRWELFLYNPDIEYYLSSNNRFILDSERATLDELEEYLKKYNGFDRW